jgi:tetratricopeptide (TPR) repeat protein
MSDPDPRPESELKQSEILAAASETGSTESRARDGNSESKNHRRVLFTAILVFGLLGLYPLQRTIDQRLGSGQNPHEELTFFPSETRLSRLSGGYSGLLAAIYWTRAVQYYGRHRLAHAKEFALLGPLLNITTELDPHLLIAYRFGSVFLAGKPPEGAGDPQQAIYLLERGIVANPDYWRLWEDLGFIYYWDMKDYAKAARAFQTGSERPGALSWMRVLAASVAAEGGEIQSSRLLWTEIAHSAENDAIRRTAESHLAALDAFEALKKLDGLLGLYKLKAGHRARSFQDLIATGYLRGTPLDPSGEPFVIGPDGRATLGPKSKVDLTLAQ